MADTLMIKIANSICIAIASHLSNTKRISYLVECLQSLVAQSVVVPVHLSISFENEEIRAETVRLLIQHNLMRNPYIHVYIREQKTPQMRHFLMMLENPAFRYEYIMFCDDDDTYEHSRNEVIIKSIYHICKGIEEGSDRHFAGFYESHCEKDHREHRHEYWCYCVHRSVMDRFYNTLAPHQDVIDNKCCDVLFGEYMRRLSDRHVFGRMNTRLYNYRVTENQDSVTGTIQARQQIYTRNNPHPPLGDPRLPDYILDWNDYLHENLGVYLHDVFLRTLVGCEINYILQAEFRLDADLLQYVDECHLKKIYELHHYLRGICAKLYDAPLRGTDGSP